MELLFYQEVLEVMSIILHYSVVPMLVFGFFYFVVIHQIISSVFNIEREEYSEGVKKDKTYLHLMILALIVYIPIFSMFNAPLQDSLNYIFGKYSTDEVKVQTIEGLPKSLDKEVKTSSYKYSRGITYNIVHIELEEGKSYEIKYLPKASI